MLESERLTLEPLREEDVDDIMTWVNDPDIIGNIATFSLNYFTREEELAYIKRMQESKDDHVFSIRDKNINTYHYIGQAGIHQIYRRSRTGRLAIVIASKEDMGKGYGTEAIRTLLDYAFAKDGLNLHKIWLLVFESNERSLRTYERVGFIKEGVLREEYYHKKCYHNMVRMSILASEWEGTQNENS